ncbi:hypothetical protein D9M73_236910 [compost metagenome]
MQGFGQRLEARIGQGVRGNHIAGLEQGHHRHRQAMLGATDDQHLFGRYVQAAFEQMTGECRPLMQAPGVGLIAQQGLQVTGQRE